MVYIPPLFFCEKKNGLLVASSPQRKTSPDISNLVNYEQTPVKRNTKKGQPGQLAQTLKHNSITYTIFYREPYSDHHAGEQSPIRLLSSSFSIVFHVLQASLGLLHECSHCLLWIKPSHLLPPRELNSFVLLAHRSWWEYNPGPENNVVLNHRRAETSRCQMTQFKHSTLNWIIMWICQKREPKEKWESRQGRSLFLAFISTP